MTYITQDQLSYAICELQKDMGEVINISLDAIPSDYIHLLQRIELENKIDTYKRVVEYILDSSEEGNYISVLHFYANVPEDVLVFVSANIEKKDFCQSCKNIMTFLSMSEAMFQKKKLALKFLSLILKPDPSFEKFRIREHADIRNKKNSQNLILIVIAVIVLIVAFIAVWSF